MDTCAENPTAVTRLPDLARLDAFDVAGPSKRFDQASKAEIPELWSRLIETLPFPGQSSSWDSYGVAWNADRAQASFDYMPAVGVIPGCVPPEGFSILHIPAATYLVFRITLDGTALHPQVKSAMATIFGTLVPASGMRVADAPEFERYDGDFEPDRPGAWIDFHVPVHA